MITVHVVSAHGLPAARAHDLNGLADPYLSISVGERKLQSRVMKSTLEPRFEQTFELYTEDCCDASGELHSLHVRVPACKGSNLCGTRGGVLTQGTVKSIPAMVAMRHQQGIHNMYTTEACQALVSITLSHRHLS